MLTKEFRLIVIGGVVESAKSYNEGSFTHVPSSKQGFDFDTEQDMLDYITDNGFVKTLDSDFGDNFSS